MRVKIRYACAGCGWRWVKEWQAPIKVAAKMLAADRVIEVPEFSSPCCGEHAAN